MTSQATSSGPPRAGARPPGAQPPGAQPPGAQPPGAQPPGARAPEVRAALADLRGLLSTPGSQTVLLDASRDPNACVTVLITAPGRATPGLAVKVATTPAAASLLAREADFLARLAHRGLHRVGPTLPELAGRFDADGLLAVASSVLPGVPMRAGYHAFRHLARPAAVRTDFAAAGAWLAALHADSSAGAAPIALLDGVADRIAARWPGDQRAARLAGHLGPLAARLAATRTPRTVVHGDFWAGNLLLTGGTVTGVVDWAAGELAAEPLRDVARFALSYALYLDRHTRPGRPVAGHPGLRASGWGAGIEYAITGPGWFSTLVRGFVGRALSRLGADPRLCREVLLAGLAEVAATADHPEFAAHHRDLLLRLVSEVPQ